MITILASTPGEDNILFYHKKKHKLTMALLYMKHSLNMVCVVKLWLYKLQSICQKNMVTLLLQ